VVVPVVVSAALVVVAVVSVSVGTSRIASAGTVGTVTVAVGNSAAVIVRLRGPHSRVAAADIPREGDGVPLRLTDGVRRVGRLYIANGLRTADGLYMADRLPSTNRLQIATIVPANGPAPDVVSGRRVGIIVRKRICHPVRGHFSHCRVFVLVGMRVSPKHKLLDNEEDAEPDHQRHADRVLAAGSHALHRFGQKPQQRCADQRACCKAHEVRQHPKARLLRQQQEKPRERGARNTADRSEDDYQAEKGQGRSAFVTPSRTL
jgi:hypothetical protein